MNNQLISVAVGTGVILATTAVYYVSGSKDEEYEFPVLRGIQLYHAWNFFQRRYDFLQSNFGRNLGKSFSFNVLHHKVIALTGEDARQAFFSHPHFNIDEGYKILMGTAPVVSDVNVETEEGEDGNVNLFNRKLNKLLNRSRIQSFLHILLRDIIDMADKWGNGESGRIDSFIEIYDLVVVTTARMSTCHDLTKNEADLKKIGELFMTLQGGATPTSVLLPWFPSPARNAGKEATTRLFTMLYTYVETRRHAVPTSDAIDVMIADGETTRDIVGYVMAMLFVGVTNTSIISCWMLIHLAIYPEWRKKCEKEIQYLLSRHLDKDSLHSATSYEKLSAIPFSAWEDELPVLDACIRESQRIVTTSIALRRNLGGEIKIGGRVVRQGDFLVYPSSDAHLNPEYYPEPHNYDPGRWLRPDPVPDTPFPFVGWGVGRHPCTGMKVAKLEMKLILATFLTRYEYELVDKDGKFPDLLPVPNRNDIHQARPLGAAYYFDFKKVS